MCDIKIVDTLCFVGRAYEANSSHQNHCFCVLGDDVANPDHFAPVVGDYIPHICWNFTYGDWQHREFYSPGYPYNYPNNTQCIGLLVGE